MMNKMSKRHTIMKSLFATIASVLMLAAVSVAQAQPFAYIAENSSGNVSVINTPTNAVVATVVLGAPLQGIAVNPAGTRVYATTFSGDRIFVIDTAIVALIAAIGQSAGTNPAGIAFNAAGTRGYVANVGNNTVLVFDTASNGVVANVAVGAVPVRVAVAPVGARAYVTNAAGNSVSVIDTTNNTVVATVPVGLNPRGVAVNPAGTRVYVTNANAGNVSVIDTSTNLVVATVTVGTNPDSVAINPAGTRAYVTNESSNSVSVIDTMLNTVIATVAVGSAPEGVALNAAGTLAYVANFGAATVSVIDTASNTVVATTAVGANPRGVAVNPTNNPMIPGAPTAATAVAGDGQATVSYTPPAFNGGSTITTYTATSIPGDITGVATGGPIIVNGLTNGTAYTFTVTATNGAGVGLPSAPSNSVTPAAALVACQFIPVSGAWIVPANWSNCAGGNGVPAGTPGTANRADIFGKTAILPTGTLNVGEINLSGAAVIQGTGLATSTLNVVAAGATVWGTGSYTFQNMTVVFTGSFPVDAFNGTLSVDNSVLVVSAPSSGMAASAVTITGTGAKISNGGVFLLYTSLTMTAGGVFENNSTASFSPQAAITINGTFVNQGAFVTQVGFPITLANAATFSQPAASGLIVGDGIISAIGQVLTVANGLIVGTATFNVGTLSNTGAVVAPSNLSMIGTITVNGNYVGGPAASVNIKIAAGMPSPVSDQLVVSGTSSLANGIANFSYIDAGFGPYVPVQGNTFNFITAGAVAGTFSSFTFPPSGNAVSLTYTPTVVQFVVGAPSAPAITVAGTTAFPSTAVGASSGVQAITITNSGTGTLTLNSITHSNASVFPDTRGGPAPNATHYCGFGSSAGGVPNTGAPINIAPAASCALNLIFAPNVTGVLTGNIIINSNAPTSPTTIALSGTGLPPTATITPASALFGNTPVSLGVNQAGTFGNPSAAPYTITSLVAAGLGFSVVPSGASPCSVGAIVAGGGSCTYTVTFTATGPGSSNGTVTVGFQPFGAGPSFSAIQSTSGNGFIPPSTNAPASINFGNVPVTLTVTQNFTFTNTSNTTMFPASYTLASIVTGGLGFSAVGSGATPCTVSLVLAPGTSCTMTVSFQIGGTGSSNGTTTIGYQAGFGANPVFSAVVSLVGNGILMPSSLAPTNAAFGNVPVGTPVTQAFTFTNDSNTIAFPSTYTLTSFTTSGLGFTAVGSGGTPCATGLTLAPGASCGATVTFLILVTGASNGTTTIGFLAGLGSNPAYSLVFTSSGNGVLAPTTPSMTVAFAPATVGINTNAALTLTLTNPTASSAFISSGSVTIPAGLAATAPPSNTCGTFGSVGGGVYSFGMGFIPAMGSCTIVLTVQSAAAGGYTVSVAPGALNAGGANTNSSTATLTVAALLAPTISFAVAPTSIVVGGTSVGTLTINNPNAAPLTANPVLFNYLPGLVNAPVPNASSTCVGGAPTAVAGAGSYTQATTFTLPPSGSCTFSATITSNTAGVYSGNIAAGLIVTPAGSSNATPFNLTVTAAPTGPFAYVPNFGSFSGTTVSVIDIATNVVAATVTVGAGPVFAIVNSAGTRAYIANQQGNSVSVIDTATNAVVATVPVGSQPAGIAVNPAGTRLYAPNQTSNNLTVVDTTTNTVITTIAGLAFPVGAVVNPAGSRVYVTTFSSNAVAVIDTATNAVIATIPVCASPFVPAINPAGTRVYVDCTSGTVSVIDTATNLVAATVPVGTNARGIAVNPAGTAVYVANNGSNTISVISTATNTVTATLPSPGGPLGGAFNPAGTRFYVANSSANSVSVFDTATNTLLTTVPVGANPFGVGIVPGAALPSPGVALAPALLNFGTRTLNTTSPAQTVTLTNSGTLNLVISSISGSGDFGFTSTCPLLTPPLVPAAACVINVTFTPLTVAVLGGTITVTSNAPGSPHTIALSGTGSSVGVPNISLAPTALNFGAQAINTASFVGSIIVSNTGFANLILSSINVSAPFSRVGLAAPVPPDCGVSLAPGSSCQIGVVFSPTTIGAQSGQVNIIDNAAGSPRFVPLSGTGTQLAVPTIAANGALAFGDQIINTTSAPQTLTVSNTGAAPLIISAITLTGTNAANFTLTGQSGCASIAPAASCTLAIAFLTTTVGVKTAQINITSNAQNAAVVTTSVSGNGILAPRAVVNVTTTTIGFGNVIFGGAAPNQGITLTNSGGQALSISSIVLVGDFVQMNNCGTSLAAQATCTLNIVFTPLAQGLRVGELILTTNATTSPNRIPLSGTGCRWFSQSQSRLFLTSC